MRERPNTGFPINWLSGVLFIVGISTLWLAYAANSTEEISVDAADVAPFIVPAVKGEQCVADVALMRTDHMEFLLHQRDETVIDGIRSKPFSLVGCVDCHAQTTADGMPVRIDAEGQFCESCHTYAAVKIDCFTCHAAVPEPEKVVGLLPGSNDTRLAASLTRTGAGLISDYLPDVSNPSAHGLLNMHELARSANHDMAERHGR